MKIFIDFDDVLFNTEKFRNDLQGIFIKNGVTEKQSRESYQGKTYDLKKQMEYIGEKYAINIEKLKKDINIFLSDLRRYVFPDTFDFLGSFSKEDVCIVSYGHKDFQNKKIKNCGLEKYFSKIIITDSVKSEVVKNLLPDKNICSNEDIYFLDDRVDYIEDVKKNVPQIKTILMKRKEGRYKDQKNKYCDFECSNFKQAKKVIKSQ